MAELAGVEPLGLRPLRRSVFVFPPPAGVDAAGWPMVWDIGNRFYFEPEGPLLLVSPVDEIPSEPCDARPRTEDVALGVEELEAATSLRVRGVRRTWAGLRTFAPDGVPVCGFDPGRAGFFWLAGQGRLRHQDFPGAGPVGGVDHHWRAPVSAARGRGGAEPGEVPRLLVKRSPPRLSAASEGQVGDLDGVVLLDGVAAPAGDQRPRHRSGGQLLEVVS